MTGQDLSKRKYIIGLVATAIVVIYLLRLLSLQILSDDFKSSADSNAFLKQVQYPGRGLIMDRNGKLMVYNEPVYNIMVIMQEQQGVDTLAFCQTVGIDRQQYIDRMTEIKDRTKNRSYSPYVPQLFMSQVPAEDFSAFQEKLFRFNGFYVEKRTTRRYATQNAALVLGDVAEVSPADIDSDAYYRPGDAIGKLGIERQYEKQLRGVKGLRILLRDARGRIKGSYQNGAFDKNPEPGKTLHLTIDSELQALGERLMRGKIGSIVAIEPQTGEVLAMVSAPSFDPHLLVGPNRGDNYKMLRQDPHRPLLNRAIMGQYPPGSTFKTSQGLTFLQEGVIGTGTRYPCSHGFHFGSFRLGCHGHASPADLGFAIQTSCNAYFCWGLYHMIGSRKYGSARDAMNRWRDHMVAMGFGYPLGIDLPSESRGMIPNGDYYDSKHKHRWNGLSVISIAIGQGEVTLTPLQIANLGATIANRGYFITPHMVREVEGEPLDTLYTTRRHTLVEPRHYEHIVNGMRRAVLGGTCKKANYGDMEICGKTGTAQNRGQDHSVFMGFAPKDNPKIAIAVYVENGGFGAVFGVPIGALMIEQYLNGQLSEASQTRAASLAATTISYGTRER